MAEQIAGAKPFRVPGDELEVGRSVAFGELLALYLAAHVHLLFCMTVHISQDIRLVPLDMNDNRTALKCGLSESGRRLKLRSAARAVTPRARAA